MSDTQLNTIVANVERQAAKRARAANARIDAPTPCEIRDGIRTPEPPVFVPSTAMEALGQIAAAFNRGMNEMARQFARGYNS